MQNHPPPRVRLCPGARRPPVPLPVPLPVPPPQMYAAPLSVMGEVLRTKSVQYMPLPPSLCVILVSSLWITWSLLGSDMFVLLPNMVRASGGVCEFGEPKGSGKGGGQAASSTSVTAAGRGLSGNRYTPATRPLHAVTHRSWACFSGSCSWRCTRSIAPAPRRSSPQARQAPRGAAHSVRSTWRWRALRRRWLQPKRATGATRRCGRCAALPSRRRAASGAKSSRV